MINNSANAIQFEFDNILQNASQETVFTQVGAEVCESVLAGYNGTVFAYGQTGAGKTFTMSGDAGSDYKQRGVIPRAVHHVFREMDLRTEREMTIRCSYLEIYNESMYDLLADDVDPLSGPPDLVVVDRDGQSEVKGLTKRYCATEAECLAYFFEGEANRAVADHVLNKSSSRSHCIFTLHVESRNTSPGGDDRTTVAKLHLVDLAGSERVKKTHVTGQALKEATYINKSLTFLEQIVTSLSRGDDVKGVPFRQSKLTSVLRDALGGNCKTTLVACTWPEDQHAEETVSTCRFASRVMTLKTRAVVNESKDPRVVNKKLERRITELERELAMANTFAERGAINYGPVGEVERQELDEKVRAYLDAESANADELPMESIRDVVETFRLFKKAHGEVKAELQKTKDELDQKVEEARLRAKAELEAEAEANAGEGGEGDAEGDGAGEAAGEGGDETAPELVGDDDPDAVGFAAGEAPADAAPPPDPADREASEADVAMRRAAKDAKSGRIEATSNESARRNAAFAEYKKSVAREDAARLAEEQRAVREKKLELKERCEAVNSAKADIDALAKKVEAMKASDAEAEAEKGGAPAEAASVVSAETYEAMARLKESKASYRRAFDDVKALREAIEPLALRANGTRAKLVASFQEWYEKGGGADLMVERDAEEEDMDYGEKFDQLELRRVLARDPEGGAFFAAKKELALNRHKHAPIVRSVQHMRAVGAGTPRRPF